MTSPFIEYSKKVLSNSKALANALMGEGYKLVTNGTDNHLMLWDLRPLGITGNKFESLCDHCNITLNKNSIYGDSSAFATGGVRIGTCALTTRGFDENDFKKVGEFLHRAMQIAQSVNAPEMNLTMFKAVVKQSNLVQKLRSDVESFSMSFYIPGFDPNQP